MSSLADKRELIAAYARARWWWRFESRAALERHQQRRLQRFMATTLPRSPFYAPLAGKPLDHLPVMNKALMIERFDEINTRSINRAQAMEVALAAEQSRNFSADIGGVSVGLSTGTSGVRGLFLASPSERMRWAGIILGRMLPGGLHRQHRIAFFLRANNRLYETVSGRGRITFQFFDLIRPFAEHLPALRSFRPSVLIAPAQVLRELAVQEAEARARGASPTIAPARVISVAETLFDDDRAMIERTFGRPVDQIYQCTEGLLGYTCKHCRLHLNEAFLHIEPDWLDDARTRFAPIITDFSRETQPIVRYRLDDVLAIDPTPCPCGSAERVIARIEGRADDVLLLLDRKGVPTQVMPDFIVRALAGAELEEFRVIQCGSRHLTIEISAADFPAACASAERAVAAMAERLALAPLTIRFARLEDRDFLIKRRRVRRMSESNPAETVP